MTRALLLVAIVTFAAGALLQPERAYDEADALCDTDTDCLRLCPPDDLECDGGPQS